MHKLQCSHLFLGTAATLDGGTTVKMKPQGGAQSLEEPKFVVTVELLFPPGLLNTVHLYMRQFLHKVDKSIGNLKVLMARRKGWLV